MQNEAKSEAARENLLRARRGIFSVCAVHDGLRTATHINALPTVTLMRVEDGVVPREAVYGNRQRGYRVYTVKQEDGAFGKAYFLHVVESEKIFSTEQEGKVLIGALRRETNPVAFEIHLSENEMPYEGMEVKIVG